MRYWVLAIAIALPVILSGCGGADGPTTGHAIGYIYADAVESAGDGEMPVLRLLATATSDPALRALKDVTVTIVEAEKTTRTSQYGAYAFYDLKPGAYTLQATHASYPQRAWRINVRAGYTTFGENVMRSNIPPVSNDNPDYYWDWDRYHDYEDYNPPSGGGGTYTPPPSTDDSTDDGGGISVFRTQQ